MQVTIDGVSYVPAPPVGSNPDALDVRFYCDDLGQEVSVREYFRALLSTLWSEGEGFSGKRPFGNSGWEYSLYAPLIKSGFIPGDLDEDDGVNEVDREVADPFIAGLIVSAFA